MMKINADPSMKTHLKAVFLALFVTILWSTSWVLIKIGLQASIPPVTFAGLRYTLAFLCLLPFVLFNPSYRLRIRKISGSIWLQLILLGIVLYTITIAAQYIGLSRLPSATVSLLLNFSPIFVALPSGFINKERTSFLQWGGILLTILGAIVYFFPLSIPAGQTFGLVVVIIGVLSNAGSSTAIESSIINGTMLPQIAILAWIFLGESLNAKQIIGLSLVAIGIIIVQIRRGKRAS